MHPPSIIPPNAKISDLIYPADMIDIGGITESWSKMDLWPTELAVSGHDPLAQMIDAEAGFRSFEQKTISVFLPLDINGLKKNYQFALKVARVEIQ